MSHLTAISPLPNQRRDSSCDDSESVLNLPVPSEFADSSRRSSAIKQPPLYNDSIALKQLNEQRILDSKQRTVSREALDVALDETLFPEELDEASNILFQETNVLQDHYDKDCSSMVSAISNEEMSIASDILDQKSFCPRKNSDGEDVNGHIYHIDSPETDTYPNSEALHGESLMDDMSSVLGMTGCDSGENTFTDDTTIFATDVIEKKEKQENPEKNTLPLDEADSEQFGFENPAFMTSYMFDKDNRLEETVKYCSLAQFVEGNDIARRSFKRTKPTTKLSKTEANVNRQSILAEENLSLKGSNVSLNNIVNSNSVIEAGSIFPQVSVIVEPPSPTTNEQARLDRISKFQGPEDLPVTLGSDYEISCHLDVLSMKSADQHSNHNSNLNLLTIDKEQMQYLGCSPAATRRVSSVSLLKANEAAELAASASSLFTSKGSCKKKKEESERTAESKTLPIINPLVRLPSWPRKYKLHFSVYLSCLTTFRIRYAFDFGLNYTIAKYVQKKYKL